MNSKVGYWYNVVSVNGNLTKMFRLQPYKNRGKHSDLRQGTVSR